MSFWNSEWLIRLSHGSVNRAITVRPLSSVRNFQGPDRDAINAGKALGVERYWTQAYNVLAIESAECDVDKGR